MLSQILSLATGLALVSAAPVAEPLEARAQYTSPAQVSSAIAALESSFTVGLGQLQLAAQAYSAVLEGIVAPNQPGSIEQAASAIASANAAHPTDYLQEGAQLVFAGASPADVEQIALAYSVYNNQNNINPPPPDVIYPKKAASDAPYDIPEAQLRSKIYIPPGFTYGKKQPVIFIPGTGGLAGTNFGPNFGKVLANVPYADPVYLNIPNNSLDDVQTNAEYVTYAINYLSSIAKRQVATIGWSQSALSVRWSAKYWPSTKQALSVQVQISPDYHGTVNAYAISPANLIPLPPSIFQQDYNSTFVATLRNNGGDSAYTSVTSIYTQYDEIVQPQVAGPGASGYTNDARGVGVTNEFIQSTCGLISPASGPNVDHEGVLYNSIAHALAIDSLKSGKNGNLANINTASECEKFAADGLSLDDIFATEGSIPLAAFNILAYQNKVFKEPPIKAYARKDIPPGYTSN